MRREWLEDILAISQTGSFSAAAEKRNLTQSAFSRRIKQIEHYIGVELFDRSHKPVVLRATTLAQSEEIGRLAASLRRLEADLRRGDRIAKNKIVIASQHALTTSLAPSIIQSIRLRSEMTYVRLRSENLDECFGLLLSRHADVVFFYDLPESPNETGDTFLETVIVGEDRLIPVLAKSAGLGLVGEGDMAEIPIVTYPSDVFFGKVMANEILPLLPPSPMPVPMVETALTLAALEMATLGVAAAWVPEALAQDRISGGRLVDLSNVLPSCDLLVKAARLPGADGPEELSFWSQLLAQKIPDKQAGREHV